MAGLTVGGKGKDCWMEQTEGGREMQGKAACLWGVNGCYCNRQREGKEGKLAICRTGADLHPERPVTFLLS